MDEVDRILWAIEEVRSGVAGPDAAREVFALAATVGQEDLMEEARQLILRSESLSPGPARHQAA